MRIAGFLIAGILIGEQVGDFRVLPYCIAALAVCVATACIVRRHAILQTSLLFAAVVLLGLFLSLREQKQQSVSLPQEETLYKAVITSEPEVRGKVIRFDMQLLSGSLVGQKVKASLLRDTIENRYLRLHIGDGLLASSLLEAPANYRQSSFDYAAYLKRHGFAATTFIYWNRWNKIKTSLAPLSRPERTRLEALKLRQELLKEYKASGLSDEELAVTAAMTLGDKSLLNKSLKEDFSISGGSHVLALSGLHLAIIYGMLSLLFPVGRKGVLSRLLIMAGIWAYAVIVGMSPSVMRSAWMLTICSVVELLGRNRLSLNTLSLAAIILLIANPQNLRDIGFQLSFTSVFFILLMYPSVYGLINTEWLRNHRLINWLWGMTVVSFVAQLGVAPLIAFHFNRFSTYFLLTNFIVIPCATVVIYGAIALLIIVPLRPYIAIALTAVAGFMTGGIRRIAALPYADIGDIHINVVQTVMLYFFILAVYFLLKKLSKHHIICTSRP